MVPKKPVLSSLHLFLALGALCVIVVGSSAESYEAEETPQVMAPNSLFSGICRDETSYPSCFSMLRYELAGVSVVGFPSGVWCEVASTESDPSPLRVDNPFFNAPDRKAYVPDKSTPQPLRIPNPHFGS